MFENINEVFEHLEFNNEKGIRLLKILTTIGFAVILYESFGGTWIISENLSIKLILDFFLSFHIFIPILFYF